MPSGDFFLWTFVLVVAAAAAGVVNTLAGGGTLLTFPALLQFGALDGVVANATSTVALVPGSLAGAWGFRRELRGQGRWLLLLAGPSLLGGVVGALLLTRLDPRYFAALVPWLLLTASLLFLAQPALARRLPPANAFPGVGACAAVVAFQLLVAVYGGYFGAGIGILMLSALGLMGVGDLTAMNAVKTLLAALMNGVSVLVFVADDKVDWRYAPPMALGAIAGGYFGARLGRVLPRRAVRGFVIAVGLGLAGYYFLKQVG